MRTLLCAALVVTACAPGEKAGTATAGGPSQQFVGTYEGRSYRQAADTGIPWRTIMSIAPDGSLRGTLTFTTIKAGPVPIRVREVTGTKLVQELGPYHSPTLNRDGEARVLAGPQRNPHAHGQRQHRRRPRRRAPHVRARRLLVLPHPVREAVDAGPGVHPGEDRGDEEARGDPRVHRVGAVLFRDGVRGGAARLLHELDDGGARAVARPARVAGLRGDDRAHRQHVFGEAYRCLGDRRGLPARLSPSHGGASAATWCGCCSRTRATSG